MTIRARPPGLSVVAGIAAIGGVVFLLASAIGVLMLIGASVYLRMDLAQSAHGVTGVGSFMALLISSVAYIVFAIGAFTLRRWAWGLGMLGAGFSVVSTIVAVASGGVFELGSVALSLALALVIVFYLRRPAVKAAFGQV